MHRDEKLDGLIGKRVTITFTDGDRLSGLLTFDERMSHYVLKNAIDEKKGFSRNDTAFRKSHVKSIKEKPSGATNTRRLTP